MPEGTPVLAARAGLVVDTQASYDQGGPERSQFYGKANYITLQHNDGTLGRYAHLRFQGVRVTPAKQVQAGEFLGYSGNTGWSTDPHLHFCVQKPQDARTKMSLPMDFQGRDGERLIPELGQRYTAR